ncbi:uncharacterized protein LOC127080617 [Lathyrus oleraceus]|uniref:uncharacterized protein LOC127080617 n=1 Tax=Pisum sativum TaxID=3888 RepID=UPI0021D26AD8|nr:uncharacterized protein LOC127080617 [Pisum sativum]
MSQPSISTPSNHTKEQSNPKNVGIEIYLSDVITDVVPFAMVLGHATPIRKARSYASRKSKPSKVSTYFSPSMAARNVKILEPSTAIKKPHSMTSLYLYPINVEPNIGSSKECLVMPNVKKDVKAYRTSNIPRAQPDNTTETPMDKSDVNVSTQSPEKSKDKEESDGIPGGLDEKEGNSIDKNDQSTNIVNIEDLDSNHVPIGQRLAPRIAKMLKNKKGQAIESSSTPCKSLRRRTSVGPTKRQSKVITPVSQKKSLKRKEIPSESSESDHDVEHNVQDIISTARKQASRKKIPTNIPEVQIDNISFHSMENVEKWKLVYQTRLALEREQGKNAFECK